MSGYLIDNVFAETLRYLEEMPKLKRKAIGQFFTSVETAQYMASLFDVPVKSSISILDPGTGSGILTAAVIDRLQLETQIKHVKVTCYEISKDVMPILKKNMAYIRDNADIEVEYEIFEENYIAAQRDDFNDIWMAGKEPPKYDWVICNPPYRKIAKDAAEAASMPAVCYGAPNMYFLFTAMGLFNLCPGGQMVFIIPRSWTSGAYFRRFREYLLENGSLRQIHLFVSRDRVFDQENVLQETVIIKVEKSKTSAPIRITCSDSNRDFCNITSFDAPYASIVGNDESYIYLVTNEEELKTLQTIHRFCHTLPSLGLKMRTGLTVDFRCTQFLRTVPAENTVPLFYPHHIRDGRIVFPAQKGLEYLTTDKNGLLQPNRNYLLVKRFTTKEERRRLQCGIYLSADQPGYEQISTQNKVNFIEAEGFDMSKEQVYGLYVLFNSTIYDRYYRILNGSTQVNSTEVNTMPVPALAQIEALGAALIKAGDLSVRACDEILGELLNEQNR